MPNLFRPLFAAILVLLPTTTLADEGPPNIVLLLADDLGWTGLSCYGSDLYETPNLDRLASKGIRFTDAYAACTVCSPTRASIMTGMYPARLHLTDFIAGQNRPFAKLKIPDWQKGLPLETTSIAEDLGALGYRTGMVGKWHLSPRGPTAFGFQPAHHGFDFEYQRPAGTRGYFVPAELINADDPESVTRDKQYLTDWLTDQAIGFISQESAKPFFLYFAYNVPHTPIEGRPDLVEKFRGKVSPDAIHNNPEYAAMVASLDESVGRILQTLNDLELADNTMVLFCSDNGGLTQRYGKHDGFTDNLPLRRGKGSSYEGGVRVPMIVRWPGVAPAGTECAAPVMTIDFLPTCVDVALRTDEGIRRQVDGVSLLRWLRKPDAESPRRDLFWHYPHYHAGGDGPYSAIRSGKMRLIENHEDSSVELYDLSNDIAESHNIAESEPAVSAELLRKLHDWRTTVDAQMPQANPDYDPERATLVAGKKGGDSESRPVVVLRHLFASMFARRMSAACTTLIPAESIDCGADRIPPVWRSSLCQQYTSIPLNQNSVMTDQQCRWGILSTAGIARKNWAAIAHTGNGVVAAVASRSAESAQKFIDECQMSVPFATVPEALGSYDQLLASKDIDAVYVPLPTGMRKEWVVKAAEAGKHVVVEKPCGVDAAEVREMIDACAANDVQFMDGVMFMHTERLKRMREVLDIGNDVGRIRRISTMFTFYASPEWRKENIRMHSDLEPMGCLGDLGWYTCRFSLFAMKYAMPRRVSGRILDHGGRSDSPLKVPTEFSGELFFDDGVSATFYNSFQTQHCQAAYITGEKGYLHLPDFVLPYYGNASNFETSSNAFEVNGCHYNFAKYASNYRCDEYASGHKTAQESNLYRCMSDIALTGKLDPFWPEVALKTQKLLDACLQSAKNDGAMVDIAS